LCGESQQDAALNDIFRSVRLCCVHRQHDPTSVLVQKQLSELRALGCGGGIVIFAAAVLRGFGGSSLSNMLPNVLDFEGVDVYESGSRLAWFRNGQVWGGRGFVAETRPWRISGTWGRGRRRPGFLLWRQLWPAGMQESTLSRTLTILLAATTVEENACQANGTAGRPGGLRAKMRRVDRPMAEERSIGRCPHPDDDVATGRAPRL
jgi:hypothetical protein